MRVFLLEDDPNRVQAFKYVLSLGGHELQHAIDVGGAKLLWTPPYDLILLDHDLGGETFVPSEAPNTGYEFVSWVADSLAVDVKTHPVAIVIHSWNSDGARNMKALLASKGIENVNLLPFSDILLKRVEQALKGK